MSLLLEIVTPEKKVYDEEIDSVILPTVEGEICILPGHIPLITLLNPGNLIVTRKDQVTCLAVDKGLAQVLNDKVAVLTEGAIDVKAIDLTSVIEAQNRAEEALKKARESKIDPAEIEELETVIRFSLAQKLAKEGQKKGPK